MDSRGQEQRCAARSLLSSCLAATRQLAACRCLLSVATGAEIHRKPFSVS